MRVLWECCPWSVLEENPSGSLCLANARANKSPGVFFVFCICCTNFVQLISAHSRDVCAPGPGRIQPIGLYPPLARAAYNPSGCIRPLARAGYNPSDCIRSWPGADTPIWLYPPIGPGRIHPLSGCIRPSARGGGGGARAAVEGRGRPGATGGMGRPI